MPRQNRWAQFCCAFIGAIIGVSVITLITFLLGCMITSTPNWSQALGNGSIVFMIIFGLVAGGAFGKDMGES